MRVALALAAALALTTTARAEAPQGVIPRVPESPDPEGRYLFYLHGRIVEEQGLAAVSPDHGPYEYAAIVRALADAGLTVIGEVRARDTDPEAYADSVAAQIGRLLAAGVRPRDVTVLGASKGAVIAMLVSTRLAVPVRYVLLANCNDYILRTFTLRLHGDVLSIYDAGDPLGQSCQPLFDESPDVGERREIRLDTGLGHGFIFRPLESWLRPAIEWARDGGVAVSMRP